MHKYNNKLYLFLQKVKYTVPMYIFVVEYEETKHFN